MTNEAQNATHHVTPQPSQHPRMSGEDRRRQLIEVAIDHFARRGFGGTTTREIAADAGVTEAIIFRHFATKQDLYAAILDHIASATGWEQWVAELDAAMEKADDASVFRLMVSRIVDSHRLEPRFERLLLHAALEGNELALMRRNQVMTLVGVRLRDYFQARQRAGVFFDCNPASFIFAVVGMAEFYGMRKYMFQLCEPESPDEEIVEAFTRILIQGVKAKE